MNIELYIANKLCDLEKSDLSIRLKRQFINPTELNIKDAQKSYSITLPSTPTNDKIFRYSNVEETEGKFSLYPNAKLYVNGILILDGKFRLTEITRDSYRGNLGVPAPLTVKDVFGEMKMNETGKWELQDWNRQAKMSQINKEKNPELIFPLTMYKLFGRNIKENSFLAKDMYDEKVLLDFDDILPSINCIGMLQKIFSNADYKLTGTALTDERLKALYVSYRNPNDYPINWDIRSGVKLSGDWTLWSEEYNVEPERAASSDSQFQVFSIFEGKNHALKAEETKDKENWIKNTDKGIEILIPKDGLYKVSFELSFNHGDAYFMRDDIFNLNQGNWNSYGHSTEICLVKKNNRQLKDHTLLFNPNLANGIKAYQPYFFQDQDTIAAYSMGKTNDAANYRGYRVCTPMVVKGSAAKSPGYGGNYEIEMLGDRPETQIKQLNRQGTFSNGVINQIVWLKQGDVLELIDVSTRHQGEKDTLYQHNLTYTLQIQPFRKDKDWLKIKNNGSSAEPINWFAADNYYDNTLNITQFLPSEVTINDWIDNFCKAFNLKLVNTGNKTFRLDVKNTHLEKNSSLIIDLDQKANIQLAQNEALNLPMLYELGFTVNNSEHGYMLGLEKDENGNTISNTGKDGGGRFATNSLNTNILKQNSNFSYCWYKPIRIYDQGQLQNTVEIPIITDNEIWGEGNDYKEMMTKKYLNKAQRFWFKTNKNIEVNVKNLKTSLALVSNTYSGDKPLELNYEDKPNSIMRNYFMLMTNEKNYTVIECYLTPQQYSNLGKALVRFNGDMYIVAEADGYDPMGKSKTKLKMIKKM